MSGPIWRVLFCIATIATMFTFLAAPASADCDTEGGGAVDGVLIESDCSTTPAPSPTDPGAFAAGSGSGSESESESESRYVEYVWSSVCVRFDPRQDNGQSADCFAARRCQDPIERVWDLWARRSEPDAGWELLGQQCLGARPTVADTPKPQVTPGLVLDAIRRIGLPSLEAQTQPEGKTLVNFATIFYADPQPFTRTIRLLGQQVDVEATPSEYAWDHGDGTTETTTTPGAPYPAKDITYNYTDAHTTVNPSVDVTYTARFRVNGGRWQDIADTVTIAGPAGNLRISEATAVLSGQYY